MANILLLEPNQTLVGTYVLALEESGYNVMVSGNAQDAVHKADEAKPDAVVLELQLPGHSGIEFLYEFRSYPEWQNIPAIIHTLVPPNSLKMTEQTLEQLFISAYLYKPATSLKKLLSTIGDALKVAA